MSIRWFRFSNRILAIYEEMAGKFGVIKWDERRAEFGARFEGKVGLFTMEYANNWEVIENPELIKETK